MMALAAKVGRWLRRRQLLRAGACIEEDLQSQAEFFSGRARGFSCGQGAWFAAGCRVIVAGQEGIDGCLMIGDHVFVNHYAMIDCHCKITIGDNVMIGPHAYIGDFDHPIHTGAGPGIGDTLVTAPVHIGDHVWIGAQAVILKGVCIGTGAVIGAGAVVVEDVPAMAVAGGVPARILGRRAASEV